MKILLLLAHLWYPYYCCSGFDCAELPFEAVEETKGGYRVAILPGQHPMWGAKRQTVLRLFVQRDQVLGRSPDGKFHICLNPEGELLCFWEPSAAA